MKLRIQMVIESDGAEPTIVKDLACFTRGVLSPDTLGLQLAEAKDLLQGVQNTIVTEQDLDMDLEAIEEDEVLTSCSRRCGNLRATFPEMPNSFQTMVTGIAMVSISTLALSNSPSTR